MATRARLQRRLEARKREAENTVGAENTAQETVEAENTVCCTCGRRWEITESELQAAEDSGISLVEEHWEQHPESWSGTRSDFPQSWSTHRVVAAVSISPHYTEFWREIVQILDLDNYYVRKELDYHEYWKLNMTKPEAIVRRQWNALDFPNISIANRILMVIFSHLNIWDCLALINLVCRRWHLVARYVWQRMETAQIDPENAPFSPAALLKPADFICRMPALSSVTLCGITIAVGSVPKMFTKIGSLPIETLRICSATFESSAISLADANDKVCDFIRSCSRLKVSSIFDLILLLSRDWVIGYRVPILFSKQELVLMDCNVRLFDKTRNRRELRSLDLWYFEFSHPKTNRLLKIDEIQLSAKMLQRFADNFKFFCKQVFESKVKAIILCGLATSNYAAGLSRANFVHGFTRLMPHLREISLCNLLFSDSTNLKSASLDLLTQQIRRNSNLELFCLTNAEISEEAIYNLQRCEKLQILILLRCSIASKYPDLPLFASWHPNSNLPSSLITDDVTVPRWFKPTYFRVVRIDSFTQFGENKFLHLRNRWWTIRALLKSAELNLPDLCFASLYMDPEEIIGDAIWLQE